MEVLEHQRQALDEIVSRARAFFRSDWRGLPIQPRWASLLVGSTGTGKTAVAAMAAEALSGTRSNSFPENSTFSLLRVSAPSWMPVGAHNRGTKETISVIAAHVDQHDRTILVADEIDKLVAGTGGTAAGSDGSWQSYIRAELYDLLDDRWPVGMKDSDGDELSATAIDALTTKLKTTVFVLGIGTFQSWFDGAGTRRSMGFGAETNPETDELSADIVAENLPRELANRFNSQLIRLPELRADDYHRIARETADKLPLRMQRAFRAEVERRIAGAISAKKGVRFLEEAIMEVLKNLPPRPEIIAEIVKTNPEIPGLDLCTL